MKPIIVIEGKDEAVALSELTDEGVTQAALDGSSDAAKELFDRAIRAAKGSDDGDEE